MSTMRIEEPESIKIYLLKIPEKKIIIEEFLFSDKQYLLSNYHLAPFLISNTDTKSLHDGTIYESYTTELYEKREFKLDDMKAERLPEYRNLLNRKDKLNIEKAALLILYINFIDHDIFILKENEENNKYKRFFMIINKLFMEMRMKIVNMVYDIKKDFIDQKEIDVVLRQFIEYNKLIIHNL